MMRLAVRLEAAPGGVGARHANLARRAFMEFVSRSEITVPVEQMAALERAFEQRARLVDAHPGFLGLQLLRDIRDNGRYVLVTRWRDRKDFTAYMKSGEHERAHTRPHEGLTTDLSSGGKLEQFHVVLEARV
jgi:heme-degrading monooxygenase HmoA